MARYELNCNDGGWLDTAKPCGVPGEPLKDGEEQFACAEEGDVVKYMNTLEELIEKLSYDHECCDRENCRFCIAYDAWEQQ